MLGPKDNLVIEGRLQEGLYSNRFCLFLTHLGDMMITIYMAGPSRPGLDISYSLVHPSHYIQVNQDLSLYGRRLLTVHMHS